ncbi:MAG: hypothetical protein Q6356_003610 [Candidatus Wukongarchaeota archaeon]|nr:hypothetical protein [Candidatus Wukongarchaeota archaeon]
MRWTRRKKEVFEEWVLPFYNLSFEKQIDVLKAYVAHYKKYKKPVYYNDVAGIAGIRNTRVKGCGGFWRSLGFLEEKYEKDIPTEVTMEFVRMLEAGREDDAWRIFRGHIKNTWFFIHVMLSLKLQKMMNNDDLLDSLGSVAEIHRKEKHSTFRERKDIIKSLHVLIDLLVHSRTIKKDEKTGKFTLYPEAGAEPLELPEKKEDLIVVIIRNERYAVPVKELAGFIKKFGRKLTS